MREIESLTTHTGPQVAVALWAIVSDPEQSTWMLSTSLQQHLKDEKKNAILQAAWENLSLPEDTAGADA